MGKSSSKTKVGHHYRLALHIGLLRGSIDAFVGMRAADKTAWSGELTASGRIQINQPNLFGGEKDQGGIVGPVDVMFGEEDQTPNAYLQGLGRDQTAAWRGFTTLVFAGGRYGAMSPFAQKPSFKVRKILEGWDAPGCWYPEKAGVPIDDGSDTPAAWDTDGYSAYYVGTRVHVTDPIQGYNEFTQAMADMYGLAYSPISAGSERLFFWRPNESGLVYSKREEGTDFDEVMIARLVTAGLEPDQTVLVRFWSVTGLHMVVFTVGETSDAPPAPEGYGWIEAGSSPFIDPTHGWVRLWYSSDFLRRTTAAAYMMNPAHLLYYVRTDSEKGREPRANIDDANLRAAADKLYAEGFGLCWEYDPEQDTLDTFDERVSRIIDGGWARSLKDGLWRLHLNRADYDFETLPIISDGDGDGSGLILSFLELPSTLDTAVNVLGVRYFDIERKEKVTVWARAPGLVRQFGEIRQVLEMPWIPIGPLAAQVVERELRSYITPKRSFEIATDPRYRDIDRYQTVRFQSPKRGIADMVCIVGEKEHGTLRSGAIRWVLTQHVSGFADAVFIEPELGVDTRPPQTPEPIEHALIFEAPYVDVCASLPRAELVVLPDDVGYLLGVAARPGHGLDFSMAVQPDGGEYSIVASGDWCPTAIVNEAAGFDDVEFTLSDGLLLDQVAIGSAVVWGDEWCRLDALDPETGAVELGRGCADTVAHKHAAGERIWFLGLQMAVDSTEYTGGEAINAKLLTNTGSQQLPLDAATAMLLSFDQRQARPYPPANLLVNGEYEPSTVIGDVELAWSHRDRVAQADQLFDQTVGDVGPEPGTTYSVRYFLNGTLVHTEQGLTGTTSSYTPVGGGLLRIEVEAVRDDLVSWQMHVREFVIGTALVAEDGSLITTEDGQPIFME